MPQQEHENINENEPLWTSLEVAAFLRLVDRKGHPSVDAVGQIMLKDPSFPRPKKLGFGKNSRNRFEPSEVRAYRAGLRRAGEMNSVDTKKDGTPAKKRGRRPKAVQHA